jgi:hypothetical protein
MACESNPAQGRDHQALLMMRNEAGERTTDISG